MLHSLSEQAALLVGKADSREGAAAVAMTVEGGASALPIPTACADAVSFSVSFAAPAAAFEEAALPIYNKVREAGLRAVKRATMPDDKDHARALFHAHLPPWKDEKVLEVLANKKQAKVPEVQGLTQNERRIVSIPDSFEKDKSSKKLNENSEEAFLGLYNNVDMYQTVKGYALCIVDNFSGRGNFFTYLEKLAPQPGVRTTGAVKREQRTKPTWVLVERNVNNQPRNTVLRELRKQGGEFISGDSRDPYVVDITFARERGPTAVVTSPPWPKGVLGWVVSCEKCTEFCAILVSASWLTDVPERLAIWERYAKQDRCAEIEMKHLRLPPVQGRFFVWLLVFKDRKKRNSRCARGFWVDAKSIERVKE